MPCVFIPTLLGRKRSMLLCAQKILDPLNGSSTLNFDRFLNCSKVLNEFLLMLFFYPLGPVFDRPQLGPNCQAQIFNLKKLILELI